MSWAKSIIDRLKQGETVTFKPRGHSMAGRVEDGQEVTVYPCPLSDIQVDDVVICVVRGNAYLHIVKAIGPRGFLIGNNRGRLNGWTRRIYGKMM